MIKRVLPLGLIVCGLLIASTCFVSAADVTLTVNDDENDVLDSHLNYVSRPNVDIKNVTCIQDGSEVVLKLKLVEGGVIQDSDDETYLILYSFVLTTSDHDYSILYANKEFFIEDEEQNEIDVEDYSGIGENELQITFILPSSDEECLDISGTTWETDYDTISFMDMAPDEDLDFLEVEISSPDTGQVGKPVQFSSSVGEGTPPYTYEWDFGDGETSDSQNPKHTYENAGTYDVYLYVIDSADTPKEGVAYTTVDITADSSSNGDSGSGLTMFLALIVIIVIAGVAVLVYVIRR